ncbi:MAG: HlyD family secretion protein [Methylovirgula sp.]|uniref:HlyD family secretion protein n=1 Tax=Methylovirgula sp. TaxID=1978224 RepID=UPI0030764A59
MSFKNTAFIGLGVVALAGVAYGVDRLIIGDGRIQSTDDAYITADFSTVAPKISGLLDKVEVEDNERVKAGQELVHIDDRDYRTAVAAAEGTLDAAKAEVANLSAELARQTPVIGQADANILADDAALTFARANAQRYRNLSKGGAGTVEQQQQSAAQLQQAEAAKERDSEAAEAARRQIAILQAQRDRALADAKRTEAALAQARLNLSYTHVLAPVDGVVGQRAIRVGNYVSPGTALLAVVPIDSAYVLANYQETQLTHLALGQKVEITVDAFPGAVLTGHVDSLAPASGIAFSPIAPDNATGNFTKVVQRIPLKIVFDPDQSLRARLRVGMSVETTLDTHSTPDKNDINRALDHLATQ